MANLQGHMGDREAQERTPSHARSLSDIELADIFSFDEGDDSRYSSEMLRATIYSWHPKLTLYRLLVLIATVGLGVAKAVTSYLNLNYASITLEWILGVAVSLLFHFLGSYEEHDARRLRWLFHTDYLDSMWDFLVIFDIYRPFYQSDEINAHNSHWLTLPQHPPITGYRILVTSLVLFFGILKSAFWYGNQQRAVTTIECAFGVGLVTCLYWLGLYESSSMKVYPTLFHVDYSTTVLSVLHAGYTIADGILHIVGLVLSCRISFIFYHCTVTFLTMDWSTSMIPEHPIVGRSTSLALACLAMAVCVAAFYGVFVFLFLLSRLVAYSSFGKFISRYSGIRRVISLVYSIHQDYWLSPTSQQRRSQGFFLRRVILRQIIKFPVRVILLITLILSTCIVVWLIIMCAATLATFLEPWIPFTVTFSLLAFIMFLIFVSVYYLVVIRAFYEGFLKFLADIRYDYTEGLSVPMN